MQFVQSRMGVAAGWGGTARLVQGIGRAAALRLLLLGESIDAEAALRLGLADAVGEEGEDAVAAAMRLLGNLALERAGSLDSMRAIKRQIATSSSIPAETLASDTKAFAAVWSSSANQAAVRASAAGRGLSDSSPCPGRKGS